MTTVFDTKQVVCQVSQVQIGFGYTVLIQSFSTMIFAGQLHSVMGLNGTGKTTLLRVVAGVLQPMQGWVRLINGACFFPHGGGLLPDHTVADNMHFYKKLWQKNTNHSEFTFKQCLSRVGLVPNRFVMRPVNMLSTGQKKRLMLAILLYTHPPFILLDEPTLGLDAQGLEMCLEVIADLRKNGSALLLATHEQKLHHMACVQHSL